MKAVLAGVLAAGLAATTGAAHAQVHEASFVAANGQRTLSQWIDIDGAPACVWKQFTDEATIRASGVAMARVDLSNGGVLEEGFSAHPAPGETIRQQIITYLPERLLVLRNQATPTGLPGGELYPNIVQIIALEPREGGGTRLTLAHTGYANGAGYDQLYTFFHDHNPGFLIGAQKACESGR